MQHPLVSQANLKSENIILEQHMKQEIVARIMLKNLVSVDIQGKGGVGKTTILQNLLQHFRVSEFFGLSIPSASGTTLPKITQCIMYSMRKGNDIRYLFIPTLLSDLNFIHYLSNISF